MNKNNDVEILIVEDSPTQSEKLQYLLAEHGYRVIATANGIQALEAARQHKPSLILSDIMMPELDGYGLCAEIKRDEKLKDVPVILLTTLSDVQDIMKGLECGADNFIRKPYDDRYLLARIDYLLMSKELRQSQTMQMGVEIYLGGQKHYITAERQQIVDLMISVYEEAVHISAELKERQGELVDSNRTLTGLYQIAEGLNRAMSEREVCETTLELVLEFPGIQAGWISLREGESGFRLAAARNLPPALLEEGALEGNCECRHRLLAGDLNHAANIIECERLKHAAGDTNGPGYHASVPLWIGDRSLGIMNLVAVDQGLFKDDELETLYGVGHQVSIALERVRLHQHMEQLVGARTAALTAEITERRKIEAALRESQQVFQRLFEDANDPNLLINDGRFIECNAATLKLLGYGSKSEFLNYSPSKVSPACQPDGRSSDEKAAEMIAIALRDGYHRFEWVHARSDGSPIPIEVTLTPITVNGKVILHTLWHDITERTKSEEAIRQLHTELSQFKNALDQTLEAVFMFDPESLRFTYVNEGAKRQLGYSEAELLQMTPVDIKPLFTLEQFRQAVQSLIDGVQPSLTFETVHRHKDGHDVPVEIFLQLVCMKGQSPRFVAMVSDISERQAAQKRIEFLAYHDSLTGLPNRLLAQDRLEQAILVAERENSKVALLFIDLDNFKTINVSLGHVIGDGLLKAVAIRQRECLRAIDTLSRPGGDEFLIVLSHMRDTESMTVVAEKILERMAEPFEIDHHELSISLSIGIAVYPDDGKDFETLLRQSDTALYHAKESGRNTYRFHTDQMNIDVIEHLRMRNGLRRALDRGEFVLHYQPQISLASGAVIGAEALIRWNHPELGMVAPGRFISVAEDTGLIVPMGDWVLREACRQSMAWRKAGLPELLMAVNLSAVQFKRGDVLKSVTQALAESGLEPALLELELTESILIKDTEKVLATVRQLKSIGVKLSIDDFGTGYSSLSYLKQFDVDKLKIDQSFVRDMVDDPSDAAIVRTIIQMAKSLNLTTIAEGVEDEHQLALLRLQKCDEAQGYHFARPMPADQFASFILN